MSIFTRHSSYLNKENRLLERPSCEDACIGRESDSTMRTHRKRASSEVFSSDNECNPNSEEKACKMKYKERFCAGEVLDDDKENVSRKVRDTKNKMSLLVTVSKRLSHFN